MLLHKMQSAKTSLPAPPRQTHTYSFESSPMLSEGSRSSIDAQPFVPRNLFGPTRPVREFNVEAAFFPTNEVNMNCFLESNSVSRSSPFHPSSIF